MKLFSALLLALVAGGLSSCKQQAAEPPAPAVEAPAPTVAPAAQDPDAVNPAEMEGQAPAATEQGK